MNYQQTRIDLMVMHTPSNWEVVGSNLG